MPTIKGPDGQDINFADMNDLSGKLGEIYKKKKQAEQDQTWNENKDKYAQLIDKNMIGEAAQLRQPGPHAAINNQFALVDWYKNKLLDPNRYQGLIKNANATAYRNMGNTAKQFGAEYGGMFGKPELDSYMAAQQPNINRQQDMLNNFGQQSLNDQMKFGSLYSDAMKSWLDYDLGERQRQDKIDSETPHGLEYLSTFFNVAKNFIPGMPKS